MKTPKAWMVEGRNGNFPNGNIRLWSTDCEVVRKLAEELGVPVVALHDIADAPIAIMDTRVALGLCAQSEDDFPALYALQGHRVALIDLGPVR